MSWFNNIAHDDGAMSVSRLGGAGSLLMCILLSEFLGVPQVLVGRLICSAREMDLRNAAQGCQLQKMRSFIAIACNLSDCRNAAERMMQISVHSIHAGKLLVASLLSCCCMVKPGFLRAYSRSWQIYIYPYKCHIRWLCSRALF